MELLSKYQVIGLIEDLCSKSGMPYYLFIYLFISVVWYGIARGLVSKRMLLYAHSHYWV